MTDPRSGKHLTDRDLRALSTEEFLKLVDQDLKDLDREWRDRRRSAQAKPPAAEAPAPPPETAKRKKKATARSGSVQPTIDTLDALLEQAKTDMPPDQLDAFHRVTCCGSRLGDFPPIARVCCPYCGTWHKAASHPRATDA